MCVIAMRCDRAMQITVLENGGMQSYLTPQQAARVRCHIDKFYAGMSMCVCVCVCRLCAHVFALGTWLNQSAPANVVTKPVASTQVGSIGVVIEWLCVMLCAIVSS
jgi:hypothetical protein